jgi:hypothetical protein
MRAPAVATAALLLVGACSGMEVTRIGPKRPSRTETCQIDVFFSALPPYPVVDIASARTMCHVLSGRNACMEDLRKEACRLGAHAMYGFSEAIRADYNYVSATFGVQDAVVPHRPIHDGQVQTQAAGPSDGEGSDCDPICSPGFACRGGQCMPQCNPPCASGEVCGRKRVCESAAGKAEPARATGTSP